MFNIRIQRYATIFMQMLRSDLNVFRPLIIDRLINSAVWASTLLLVTAYVLPAFGISQEYGGVFMLAGACATAGFFELSPSVINFISDLEGERTLFYYFTLPVPTWLVLLRLVTFYAFSGLILCLAVIPIGKLFLFNLFSLSIISWPKFACILVLSNIFFGSFALLIASFIPSMLHVDNVWMRFVHPVWWLGGFQFSWYALYKVFPILAYICLLNPLTYVMEGIRSAMLGGSDYLPFAWSIGALSILTILCMLSAFWKLRRRLDFV